MRCLAFIFVLFLSFFAEAYSDQYLNRLVKKAPIVHSMQDLDALVQSLVAPLKTEKDKARVLLLWIVHNIDYDYYYYGVSLRPRRFHTFFVEKSSDIIKTRLGVCGDISSLYQQMLMSAGMKAVIVDGCAGSIRRNGECSERSNAHAWNAVWIKNKWELVDPTWAIQGEQPVESVTSKFGYKRELAKRERNEKKNHKMRDNRNLNEGWFMTDPETMIETHSPRIKKWRLLRRKDRINKNLDEEL